MGKSVCFTVPGDPVGKGRPRVTRCGTYTPEKTRAYEALVRMRLREAMRGCEPLGGAVCVLIVADYDIPASYTKKRVAGIVAGDELPTKKPDVDNIAKIIMDAANGIAWKDDAQVVCSVTVKRYKRKLMDAPRVRVEITSLDGAARLKMLINSFRLIFEEENL